MASKRRMPTVKQANKENSVPVTLLRKDESSSKSEWKTQCRKPLKEKNAPSVFTSNSSDSDQYVRKNVKKDNNIPEISKQVLTSSSDKSFKKNVKKYNIHEISKQENVVPKLKNINDIAPKDNAASGNKASFSMNCNKVLAKATPQSALTLPSHVSSLANVPQSPHNEVFNLLPRIASFPGQNFLNEFSNLSLDPMINLGNISSVDPMMCSPFQRPWTHEYLQETFTAVVEEPGYASFMLRHGVVVDVSANMAVRVVNTAMRSVVSLSACASQVAVIHPKGRMLHYGVRVEIQIEDNVSVKNAKIYPRGISFTANNMALVYLLDEAGARSTSDMFHDLYATQISDMLFMESCQRQGVAAITTSIQQLENTRYWRTEVGVDCWCIGQVFIQQTHDGFVTVERELLDRKVVITASPSNGKVKVETEFVQMTASLGDESHMFIRSRDRRFHYNGQSQVFTVRNAGHSAGFDSEGRLRIF